MRVSIGAPTSVLQHIADRSTYWLALEGESIDFYREMAMRGDTVIVDFPIHESGGSVQRTVDDLLFAVRNIGATHVVLPDVEHDHEATIKAAVEFEHAVRSQLPFLKFVGVVHGSSVDEWKRNADELIEKDVVDVIGVPNATTRDFTKRAPLVKHIVDMYSGLPLILLGAEADTSDLRDMAHESTIMGVDTTRAITLALQGIDWEVWEQQPSSSRVKPLQRKNMIGDMKFADLQLTSEQFFLAMNNITYLMRVAKGKLS